MAYVSSTPYTMMVKSMLDTGAYEVNLYNFLCSVVALTFIPSPPPPSMPSLNLPSLWVKNYEWSRG